MSTSARFLPWARAAALAGDAIVVRTAGRDVSVAISRYGPGDVTGLGPGQIRRRDPAPDSLSMPPNLFPSIELRRPDLPWCLTPGGPDASGRLRPWLALIVVEARSGSPLGNVADAKQPVIEVARADLPAPDEVALWAHVQVEPEGAVADELTRRGVARILSPRALTPSTRYVACLVPTFEAGRLAGLGQTPPDALSSAPAWTAPGTGGASPKVLLPVYDHWFFTTTESGDLETLARRLQGRDLAGTSRPLRLDVSAVSGDVEGRLAPFEGALRPLGTAARWDGSAPMASALRLRASLERTGAGGAPVVGPPVYGSIASGRALPASGDGAGAGWLEALNLDPRRRAAAGLGGDLVRAHADELVDEAWRQAGDIDRARREREGAALAEFASTRLHARAVAPLTGASALVTLAPAIARMRDASSGSVAARLATSVLPPPALGSAFRRILATKAPVAARKAGQGIRRALTAQNLAVVTPGALPETPATLVTATRVTAALTAGVRPGTTGTIGTIGTVTPVRPVRPVAPEGPVAPVRPIRRGVADAPPRGTAEPGAPVEPVVLSPAPGVMPMLVALTPQERTMLTTLAPQLAARAPAVVDVVRPKAFAWLRPVVASGPETATTRFARRVRFGDGARLRPGIGVVATPRFAQPLASWLDPAFLLAGVEIPPDTAGMLAVNAEMIEALLVGANHELARELLWRGVPLERSVTLLTRFFAAQLAAAPRDMSAIAGWSAGDALGAHVAFGERVVLVLRSRLVSRLSETAVFLARAEMDGEFRRPGATQLPPVFRGGAGLDTAYFGFELEPEELASDPGWYVVIQELAGASRFGLDEDGPAALATWSDLSWPAVAVAGGYLAVSQRTPAPAGRAGLAWGRDGAHMAGISLQRPIRLAIHSSLLVPKEG